MGGVVTKQALSKYETGAAQPSPVVLNKLAAALGVKASRFWAEPVAIIEFVAYRRKSTLPKREKVKVENYIVRVLEDRLKILSLIDSNEESEIPVKKWKIGRLEDVEEAAAALREKWDLGTDPISNLVSTLESHLIQVLEIDADDRFDGISAIAYESRKKQVIGAAVVTNRGVFKGRQRFNLAHELGHKKESQERWLSRLALTQTGYGHFYIEHNRGHHVRVATPDDPASARMGESFYRFWPRTVVGSFRSAWELERRRIARRGRHPFRPDNDVIAGLAMTAALWVAMIAWLGIGLLPY
ncbi:MAG: helix-turn-helix domain-containing protein, partial [Acidobacteria bacterium]|nr:helix-turn-helix domain-containing protein [Acidobacteriota bacterium]